MASDNRACFDHYFLKETHMDLPTELAAQQAWRVMIDKIC
jgi:hypothetical protein